LTALMVTDITKYKKGYLTRRQLNAHYKYAKNISFEDRKYNQIEYLIAYLKNFIDVTYDNKNKCFRFSDDPDVVDKEFNIRYKRDPIKHRIYREELIDESKGLYNDKWCFLEKKPWGLVASHIKPCQTCLNEEKEDEAYDVDNGLLLSLNIDYYFDKFKITFEDNGKIILGKSIPELIKKELKDKRLDEAIMTEGRKKYLEYHRSKFDERNT
ncbi:MAG: HNH endonuclease, partial [Lachnospirales bacterium]